MDRRYGAVTMTTEDALRRARRPRAAVAIAAASWGCAVLAVVLVLVARPALDEGLWFFVVDVAVAGTPDDEWGQVVTAHVVGDVTRDALRAAVKEQLPAFCEPRKLVRHDALPRTSLGKVRRAQLDPGPASSAQP